MLKVASSLAAMSIASQVIAFAALPLITALFSPEDFNNLAAFSSASLILIIIASLRLEMAIPIVSSDRDATSLVFLAGLICISLVILVWIALRFILPILPVSQELNQILKFLPLSILFGGGQAIFLNTALRQKKLQATGATRIAQTLVGILVQVGAGFWAFTQYGLVIGFLANLAVGMILLYAVVHPVGRAQEWNKQRLSELLRVARSNRSYIRYSSIDALLNTSSLQLPLFLISIYGEGAAGGFLFLAIKMFYTPSTIISGAFAKIYHSTVGAALRENTQARLTEETLFHLMRFGGGFVIAIVVLGPTVVSLLMSDEWAQSGAILIWMAPWIMLQILSSPIATVFLATENQKALLKISIFGFLVRIVPVTVALSIQSSYAIQILCISSASFYFVLFWNACRLANLRPGLLAIGFLRSIPIWGLVVASSIAFKYTM